MESSQNLKRVANDKILTVMEGGNVEQNIEQVFKLGRCKEEATQPLKIKFWSQSTANIITTRKLAGMERFKDVWLRRGVNEKEQAEELVLDVKMIKLL